jgi:hypothetical protein
MRKSFVVIALLFAGVATANAQAQVALGLKGGLNLAKLDVSDVGGSIKNKTGFHGGAFFLVKLAKFGIQPEILFSQQGSQFKFNSQDLESNFTYVNIPVLLKTYLVGGLNLQIGPQFGFMASAKGETLGTDGQVIDAAKSLYKNSDVSVALGAGVDLPFGLTVDARYNLGLSKIEDNQALTETKNQVFQISLGYKILKFGK